MAEYYIDKKHTNGNIDVKNDIDNYKGYFVENGKEEEKKYYEFGAHFPYKYLYHQLEIIVKEKEQKQRELKKKLKEKESNDQATNENSKIEDNFKELKIYQSKGKSRNRDYLENRLTFIPQMKRKINISNLNIVDNVEINLIRSTTDQEKNKPNCKKINIKNKSIPKSNIINHKNNYLGINKIINKKSSKPSDKQLKKRNIINNLNINNSADNNVIYINIFNKEKLFVKNDKINLTQDNHSQKLKFFPNPKENLKKQLLFSKGKNKRVINNLRNNNNYSFKKSTGYQNSKNLSKSKNVTLQKGIIKKYMIKKGITPINFKDNNNISNISNNSNANFNNKTLDNKIESLKGSTYNTNFKKYLLFSNKKNSKIKIINRVKNKSLLKDININKKGNSEFIKNIGKQSYISRNNKIPFCNKISKNNKIFDSSNSTNNNNKKGNSKYKCIEINLNSKNNFVNLTQQIKPKNSKKSNRNLKITTRGNINNNSNIKFSKKDCAEKNSFIKPKNATIKINRPNPKNNININRDNNSKEKSMKDKKGKLLINNLFKKGKTKNYGFKNLIHSKKKFDCDNNEKITEKIYKALLKSKKKHSININININNQHNIIVNKIDNNNGENNNNECINL